MALPCHQEQYHTANMVEQCVNQTLGSSHRPSESGPNSIPVPSPFSTLAGSIAGKLWSSYLSMVSSAGCSSAPTAVVPTPPAPTSPTTKRSYKDAIRSRPASTARATSAAPRTVKAAGIRSIAATAIAAATARSNVGGASKRATSTAVGTRRASASATGKTATLPPRQETPAARRLPVFKTLCYLGSGLATASSPSSTDAPKLSLAPGRAGGGNEGESTSVGTFSWQFCPS